MRRAFAALALAALAGAPALAQAPQAPASKTPPEAFGIRMGAPVSSLPGAQSFKPGWYTAPRPPAPDPRFEKVAVEAYPRTGVCAVQGVSPEIVQDRGGAKVRAAVDRLAQDFSARYGKPLKMDECSGLACAPEAWGEDVQTGDRRYGYRWQVRGGPVWEVSVLVLAHSIDRFVYLVQYASADLTGCRAEELATPDNDR